MHRIHCTFSHFLLPTKLVFLICGLLFLTLNYIFSQLLSCFFCIICIRDAQY